jgi:hypothetical protein
MAPFYKMRLVAFGHNYTPVHLSRQSFLAYGRTKQGIASLSPPVVASLLLIHLQKNYFIFGIRTRAARVKGSPKCLPSGSNSSCPCPRHGQLGMYHGLKKTPKQCHYLKLLTCKETLWQVFIRVYRLEITSVMFVFSTQICELLPL